MKIALLSSYTIDLLASELKKLLPTAEWYIPSFDTYAQEVYANNSGLKNFAPDLAIVSLDSERLTTDMTTGGTTLTILNDLARTCPVLMHNCVCLHPLSLKMLGWNEMDTYQSKCLMVNQQLYSSRQRNVYLIDLQGLVEEHGRSKMFDPRLFYLAKSPFSSFGLKVVARQLADAIAVLQGHRKKCLVLDLDNTLWGGVLGEDGINGIKLSNDGEGRAFFDFQRHIKSLEKSGVILALCSKNDETLALQAIREHPYMVLRDKMFAAWRINWQDKATNIREIAEELGIGLDSMVFLDDSPQERELVRQMIPDVATPDIPTDPAFYPTFISELPYFESFRLTEDDRHRCSMYVQDRERKKSASQFATLEEYLKSLDISISVSPPTSMGAVARASQLTLRTNQFNLTTKRYSEPDLTNKCAQGSLIYTLSAQDKFGDYGTVGLAIVDMVDTHCVHIAKLDTFLMSCRVIGRGIEKAFLACVINALRNMNFDCVQGEYIPTKKNGLTKGFLQQNGFDDNLMYSTKEPMAIPDWITIK